ncbi:MAG: electron transfer flavoprotein subunit beta/FixA family protein, partial [Desulfobacterales bacterium]
MKIVVCVKQIALILARTGNDPQQQFVSRDDRVPLINPPDLIAVEAGLQIKESLGGEIFLVTVGPLIAEARLRKCWAMGADRLLHLEVPEGEDLDHHQKAAVLAGTLRKERPDLVLCGQMSLDTEGGQLGARLAAMLDMLYISRVVSLEMPAGSARMAATRALERGDREIVQGTLPAVVSVQPGLYQPRYPLLKNVLRCQ